MGRKAAAQRNLAVAPTQFIRTSSIGATQIQIAPRPLRRQSLTRFWLVILIRCAFE